MAVVVRCTGCNGLARVGPEAVGLLVVCPRCSDPFLADPVPEEAAFAAPAPPPPTPPRPARAEPVAPPRPRRKRPPARPEEVHDHPPHTAGGVPFSVIVGLALLPLTIPMLWLIGPVAVGHPPALTLATPVSLAVSAAVLCLAVAYTVDWSPVTRIKGVLTLVGLAYFAGLSLYFLKKEAAEWAQQRLRADQEWREFKPDGGGYEVRMPGKPRVLRDGQPWPVPVLKLTCHQATARGFGQLHTYTVGAGRDHDPGAEDDAWFAAVERSLRAGVRGEVGVGEAVEHLGRLPHRQWRTEPRDGADALVVRVYRVNGRVYLLAAQGPDLEPEDDEAERFFGSFAVLGVKG